MIYLVRGGLQKFPSTLFAGEVVADRSSGPSPFIRILRPFRDVSAYSGVRGTLYLICTLCVCTVHMYVHTYMYACTCDSCILDNLKCAYMHGSIFFKFHITYTCNCNNDCIL